MLTETRRTLKKLLATVLAVLTTLPLGVYAFADYEDEALAMPEAAVICSAEISESNQPAEIPQIAPAAEQQPVPEAPTEPIEAPAEPNEVPAETIEVPMEPIAVPAEPNEVPAEPNEVPAEPNEVPAEPNKVPAEPNEVPTEPTEDSAEPTEEPPQIVSFVMTKPGNGDPLGGEGTKFDNGKDDDGGNTLNDVIIIAIDIASNFVPCGGSLVNYIKYHSPAREETTGPDLIVNAIGDVINELVPFAEPFVAVAGNVISTLIHLFW